MPERNKIRIAKFLSDAGVASRRKAEEIIKSGKVKIGNEIVYDLSTKVLPDAKNISVAGKQIMSEVKVYYILNKPVGYLSSVRDPHHSKTVLQLVPNTPRVVPVGRLDKDSSGLLLLTNDGDLVYKITHPKFKVKKTYLVEIDKDFLKKDLEKFKKGIKLEEGIAKADQLVIKNSRELEIVIHQGWNRQIRRMFGALEYRVINLKRIKEGKLTLGNLGIGKYKKLDRKDIV